MMAFLRYSVQTSHHTALKGMPAFIPFCMEIVDETRETSDGATSRGEKGSQRYNHRFFHSLPLSPASVLQRRQVETNEGYGGTPPSLIDRSFLPCACTWPRFGPSPSCPSCPLTAGRPEKLQIAPRTPPTTRDCPIRSQALGRDCTDWHHYCGPDRRTQVPKEGTPRWYFPQQQLELLDARAASRTCFVRVSPGEDSVQHQQSNKEVARATRGQLRRYYISPQRERNQTSGLERKTGRRGAVRPRTTYRRTHGCSRSKSYCTPFPRG